jgi:hypothetical protein
MAGRGRLPKDPLGVGLPPRRRLSHWASASLMLVGRVYVSPEHCWTVDDAAIISPRRETAENPQHRHGRRVMGDENLHLLWRARQVRRRPRVLTDERG